MKKILFLSLLFLVSDSLCLSRAASRSARTIARNTIKFSRNYSGLALIAGRSLLKRNSTHNFCQYRHYSDQKDHQRVFVGVVDQDVRNISQTSLVPITNPNFAVKPVGLLLRRIEVHPNSKRYATFTYTGTSYQVNDLQNQEMILMQDSKDALEAFQKMPNVLQYEILRDLNHLGPQINNKFVQSTAVSRIVNKSEELQRVLNQFPQELVDYYSNIIIDLSNNPIFAQFDCIAINTEFHGESNKTNVATHIKTTISGNTTSDVDQNCCRGCKEKKAESETDTILLPTHTRSAYQVLNLEPGADQEKITKQYCLLRREYEKKRDTLKLQELEIAYNTLKKEQSS